MSLSAGSSPRVSRTLSSPEQYAVVKRPEHKLITVDEGQLESVRERAAARIAIRALNEARIIDGVKVGVAQTISTRDREGNERFLRHVVTKIKQSLRLNSDYLFTVSPSGPHVDLWPLIIIGSKPQLVEKASTLACAKFLGRLKEIYSEGDVWLAYVQDGGDSMVDAAMLWDIVLKTPHVINPKTPPRGSRGIVDILAAARTRLERVTPRQALDELHDLTFPLPSVLVDIRSVQQREEHGEIPDSIVVERNQLEWKFDPRCEHHLPVADRYDLRVIVFDQDGTASSLAAASLHDIGLLNTTDIIGGFAAWKEARLPIVLQQTPSIYPRV